MKTANHALRIGDHHSRTGAGFIQIVGAGPGDPDLLTIKARRAIREADVILHDRLVDPRVIALAHPDARIVEVGKRAGGPAWSQDDINRLMVENAKAGALVIRLKSGDPLIFGRADEEIAAIRAAGIGFEIIPGITSAVAAAAAIGVSLTRRGRNSSLTLLTAQDTRGFAEHEWRALAAPGATFAIYMGLRAARFVQDRLLMHGAAADTPTCIVENASRTNQKIATAPLSMLTRQLERNGIAGPAIIFVGLSPGVAAREGLPQRIHRQLADQLV